MAMGVHEPRHDDHLRAVDPLRDWKSLCVDLPSHLSDGPIVNENLLRFENGLEVFNVTMVAFSSRIAMTSHRRGAEFTESLPKIVDHSLDALRKNRHVKIDK